MKRMVRALAVAILAIPLGVAGADAAVISISPASQNASVGDTVSVDILVSLAAGEEVGGVSLLLGFNDSIVSGSGYTVDPDAKMGVAACEASSPGACDFSGGFAGGTGSPLDLFFVADLSLDEAGLEALQGAGFRLATVSFEAIANGITSLTLSVSPTTGVFLSNWDGSAALPTQVAGGRICVGPNCDGTNPIPEPGTMFLVGSGLAIAARKRFRRGSKA